MKPINITLQVSIEDTDELITQIRQQLGNSADSPDSPQPTPVEHAPYVVTLGDGETRIAHRSGSKIYTAVIAILGLERLNDEPYLPNSTVSVVCTSPHRRLRSYEQYGRYYVYKDLTLDQQKQSLQHLAGKLGVDLIVE
ncbi:MAG: hypothetical protein OXT74_15450 [Candidatus Poribacteria bacterium]|nr:hypothetical protein [Candidatus Poribacteria bacterium]